MVLDPRMLGAWRVLPELENCSGLGVRAWCHVNKEDPRMSSNSCNFRHRHVDFGRKCTEAPCSLLAVFDWMARAVYVFLSSVQVEVASFV